MQGYEWTVKLDGTNVAGLVLEGGSINYGRTTITDQPEIPIAVLELLTKDAAPSVADQWPAFGLGQWGGVSGFTETFPVNDIFTGISSRITLGASVEISADTPSGFTETFALDDTFAGVSLRRHTGRIQAIQYTPGTVQITSTPDVEAWGRILVGGTDESTTIPAETDLARISRLTTAAGVSIIIDGTETRQLVPIPANTAPRSLLEHLQDIAESTGSLFYVDRYGLAHYRPRGTTSYVPRDVVLDPGLTLVDPLQMSLELGYVRNQIVIEYGVAATGELRPTVSAVDSAQVALYGLREYKLSTQLANQTDALDLANYLLAVLDPAWHMESVVLALGLADEGWTYELAMLDQQDQITVPILPSGAPDSVYYATVLGSTEFLSENDWQLELHLTPLDVFE